MTDLTRFTNTPGVTEALRWLLNSPKNLADDEVISAALNKKLVSKDSDDRWHAETEIVSNILQKRITSLPSDLKMTIRILCGLGEIAAHSHVICFEPVLEQLKSQDVANNIRDILDFSLGLRKGSKDTPSRSVLSAAQSFISTGFDWDGIYLAVRHILYTQEHFCHPHYGYIFVVRLALHLNPKGLADWANQQGDNAYLAPILGKILEEVQFVGNRDFAEGLIAGSNPFLKCLGCAALVTPNWRTQESYIPISQRIKQLISLGIEESDAIWISSFLLKEAMHEWHRGKGSVEQTEARLKNVRKHPEGALGGEKYAKGEIERLEGTLSEIRPRHDENCKYIEDCLNNIAQSWPQKGLTDTQMKYLIQSFVSPLEISFRLSEKLNHSANRDWLLDKNVGDVIEYLGCENPNWQMEHFYYDPTRDDERLQWGAKSHALRWANDPKKLVKQLGRRIAGFTNKANTLINEPFCDIRKPTAWVSASERLASVHLFVLWVIEMVPSGNRQDTQKLLFLHIPNHVTHLLETTKEKWSDRGLYVRDQLIQTFIWFSKQDKTLHPTRDNWILNNRISLYSRVMAVWSDYTVVITNKETAIELFRQMGQLPMGDSLNSRVFNELINLLDIAMLSATEGKDSTLADEIVSIWETSILEWPRTIKDDWLSHALFVQKVMFEDGSERVSFISDHKFARTYCAQHLKNSAQ